MLTEMGWAMPRTAAALVALSACGPGSMPASLPHPLVGGVAPAFEREATSGDRDVSVPGGARTRAIVVDFWASWCEACRVTIPALREIHDEYRGEGVLVVGVSVDESASAAQAAASAFGATFPIVMDSARSLASRYAVAQVPLTFVLDAEGRVRWVGREPSELRRAVRVVLAER